MIYRALGATGLRVSEVGLGGEHLQGEPYEVVERVVGAALNGGVNIMDAFMSEPEIRANIGRALKGRREKMLLQGHIGAAWLNGQYTRTRDIGHCKRFFEDFMERVGTDYVDIGMIHFVDTEADYQKVLENGLLDYAHALKRQGIVHAVGVSSHDPIVAEKLAATGAIDVLMFSINPAYDVLPEETDIDGIFKPETYQNQSVFTLNNVRAKLYQTCERQGVGITVMKTLGAGMLLSAQTSPLGCALTNVQLMHYALTRPAVASVMIGCKTEAEVERALAYENADAAERDYSETLANARKYSLNGRCMYCNHCLPCPQHIDIAMVGRQLDLAELSNEIPATVREHYGALTHTASECIACGSCEKNCPFGVKIIERMNRAKTLFGK